VAGALNIKPNKAIIQSLLHGTLSTIVDTGLSDLTLAMKTYLARKKWQQAHGTPALPSKPQSAKRKKKVMVA
jgi:hypothetical protein